MDLENGNVKRASFSGLCECFKRVDMTSYLSLPLDSRLKSNSRWEPEADPGSDLDPDPALLHLHAHVGGRGR